MTNKNKESKKNKFSLNLPFIESFIYRELPHFFLRFLHNYFRLEIEGIENIPLRGKALIIPNHSGFAGIDAMILSHEIFSHTQRVPRVLSHSFWFQTEWTSIPANKMGFVEASLHNGLQALSKNNLVVLFPEGEHGNFKPSLDRYQLQEFKRGFIRMALETQSPIIPTLILGAEESNLSLSQIQIGKFFKKKMILPIPLNFIPLPAKWKLKFLKPIYFPYEKNCSQDIELVHDLCADIQELMQTELIKEFSKRNNLGGFL